MKNRKVQRALFKMSSLDSFEDRAAAYLDILNHLSPEKMLREQVEKLASDYPELKMALETDHE